MTLDYLHHSHQSSRLKILGDVNNVLNGKVSPLNIHHLSLSSFAFALGAGTFTNIKFLGETLILNQTAHVSFIGPSSAIETESSAQFVKTPFLVGVKKEAEPDALIHGNFSKPITLEKLYTRLIEKFPSGFAVAIDGLFTRLESSYLKKPPVFNENINGEKEDEYWAPKIESKNQRAVIFGVVITPKGIKKFGAGKVSKAFYQNPKEISISSFLNHTHGGLINETDPPPIPKDLESFKSHLASYSIQGVRHILSHSLVKEAVIALYKIDEIKVL